MEHVSLYKNGHMAFTYEEPEIINTPIDCQAVFQYLQDTVQLERTYTIRDFVKLLKSYPELMKIHSYSENLIMEADSIPKTFRNSRLNYLSFECIHEIHYMDANDIRTETYTNIDVYSGMDNEVVDHILDHKLSDIIDLPIIIRGGMESEDNMQRVYIDKVSFLNLAYELIDYLSFVGVSAITDTQVA